MHQIRLFWLQQAFLCYEFSVIFQVNLGELLQKHPISTLNLLLFEYPDIDWIF